MLDLQQLGFTQEELQQRVINQICDQLLKSTFYDYNQDSEYQGTSPFASALEKKIKEQVDGTISDLAAKHVIPNVSAMIENLTLQETNKWGEKTGKQVTFIEYLVQRAEAYMQEKVDSNGQSKTESSSSYWDGKQTRITYLINKHLQYSIETAMKDALKIANNSIVAGLEATVKQKLAEVSQTLKVSLNTK